MPELSLIIATLGRTLELDRLMTTLTNQSFKNFEIIIVDQNEDDRLNFIAEEAKNNGLTLTHLRHHPPNLAHARNRGIATAKGRWCGFPDDDCWYEPTTLERLLDRCRKNDVPHGVVGRWVEQDSALTAASLCWKKSSQFRDLPVSSITLFLQKSVLTQLGGFDKRLGVGLWFGAAEETDLVLRALKAGSNIIYDPSIRVHHKVTNALDERQPEDHIACKKRARGTGALYAKHNLSAWVIIRGLLAPILRPWGQGHFTQELKKNLIQGWATSQGRYQGWRRWKSYQKKQLPNFENNKALS
jgi:glycosyltransferase involved in cell wall biosynthesis